MLVNNGFKKNAAHTSYASYRPAVMLYLGWPTKEDDESNGGLGRD
ncbi:MAG: hypothetical protein AB2L11_01660 [Syntrophobacteraceae bacterium]